MSLYQLRRSWPEPRAVLELLKPITWFAPIWAFGCGAVSSGVPLGKDWPLALAGLLLVGPCVCGASQAVNDWFDRDVDAINEPHRPVPSGRMPDRWGLYIAIGWSVLSLVVAASLGTFATAATILGLALAWAYSAPPLRLKRNGWWGNAAVAACYEGLPWLTATAIMTSAVPDWRVFAAAALYSVGAHGIMTLNDFKSIEGDRAAGIRSLPAQLGVRRSAEFACIIMVLPQIAIVMLLFHVGRPIHAGVIAALLTAQLLPMHRFLQDPRQLAPWYNATGTTLYVLGMLVTAFALRPVSGL